MVTFLWLKWQMALTPYECYCSKLAFSCVYYVYNTVLDDMIIFEIGDKLHGA